jgi:lipoprotein-anchoring transpeptidase ErfK/SrfK
MRLAPVLPASRLIMSLSSRFAVRLMAALALGVSGAAVAHVAPALAGARHVPATQRLVVIERDHAVFARPDHRSTRIEALPARRPITGERTVVPVLGHTTGADDRKWLHVRLPGRPNSHTGWIAPRSTSNSRTAWHLLVDVSERRVTVYDYGRVLRRFRAVVGKPSTPTPHGRFFVEENVLLSSSMAGAPFALALSARSNVFQEFEGGPGQIALHGLGGVGGVPGTAASHGCVRLDRRSISWLAARMGPGVPVTITG